MVYSADVKIVEMQQELWWEKMRKIDVDMIVWFISLHNSVQSCIYTVGEGCVYIERMIAGVMCEQICRNVLKKEVVVYSSFLIPFFFFTQYDHRRKIENT